ncbi:protein of unknown function [Arthrobacter alpinus]|uniref:DUF4194 domain-containing protein n=1 Tax=Arthrobacter alpinus TaxID=656366 RepID=A0A1H5MVJ0_9MICC|nr:DUF4194 domain-containing protein [Arthrobacter alpinus]SEE93379.1 protein of unknown function [Arthrobacter alpinus]
MSTSSQSTPQLRGAGASARAGNTGSTERILFDGDTGSFPLELRQGLVRLLRGPYVDGAAEPALWNTILTHSVSLQQYFSEIFLLLTVDSERKIALLAPAGIDAVHTQPIVARKPLRREETLLALRLRVLLDRHAGSGTDVGISRAAAREILAEHRQPGTVDDKRLDEQTDAALARLLNLKLILPTELEHEYRVSNALALALPFDSIDQIPAYLAALEKTAGSDLFEATADGSQDENDAEETINAAQEIRQ